MMDIFSLAKTYTHDMELFRRLGLKPFSYDVSKPKGKDKHFVGKVTKNKSTCKVWVTCLPAQFWAFEIYSNETNMTTLVQTGSGCLADYWEVVEKIMDGMFVIKKVATKGE